jgi:hypothetical protein
MTPLARTNAAPVPDPLIDEVRAIRQRISEEYGHDVDRLVEHLREIERQHPARVVQPADVRRAKPATP